MIDLLINQITIIFTKIIFAAFYINDYFQMIGLIIFTTIMGKKTIFYVLFIILIHLLIIAIIFTKNDQNVTLDQMNLSMNLMINY